MGSLIKVTNPKTRGALIIVWLLGYEGKGRLLSSSGEALDGSATVKEAKLRHGEALTLHVGQVHVAATKAYIPLNPKP